MRLVGRVAACGCALALTASVLHVALPPNETPGEGPADRFLRLRRPLLHALEALPFLGFRAKRFLPSASEVTTTEGTGGAPVCRQETRREPVYRGLFWRVGCRVAYGLTYFREHDEVWRAARLCYVVGDECVVAGENPTADPRHLEVSGFVPDSARGYWVEYTDDKGERYWLSAWGRTEPFVDDSSTSPRGPRRNRWSYRGG